MLSALIVFQSIIFIEKNETLQRRNTLPEVTENLCRVVFYIEKFVQNNMEMSGLEPGTFA